MIISDAGVAIDSKASGTLVELGGGLLLGAATYLIAAVMLGSEELTELLAPLVDVKQLRSRGERRSSD